MKSLIIFLVWGMVIDMQAQGPEKIETFSTCMKTGEVNPSVILKVNQPTHWKITGNHWVTGGLVLLAGAGKGFNETLQFHWKSFRHAFPNANQGWFNPAISWRNKYEGGDPNAGPKFAFSTSLLVMVTDQYHLNNFINKAALTSALVIKIGEGKKPFRFYVFDFLFYSICHQLGFIMTYYPFKNYKGN